MRKRTIVIIIVAVVALLAIKGIMDYSPYFIGGAPLPVFGIYNQDSKNHNINVKVYNANNELIINKTFELGSLQSVQYPEKWDNYADKDKLYPGGTYKVEAILDNNINKTESVKIYTWQMVSIRIDKEQIYISNPVA